MRVEKLHLDMHLCFHSQKCFPGFRTLCSIMSLDEKSTVPQHHHCRVGKHHSGKAATFTGKRHNLTFTGIKLQEVIRYKQGDYFQLSVEGGCAVSDGPNVISMSKASNKVIDCPTKTG